MTESKTAPDWGEEFWYRGKVTRRRLIGYGAGALGAAMLVPAPWRAAFGQAKPYKIGALQPLSGAAAAGGKTALVGTQMAVDRINKSGGINGRPIELIVADYESKPDVGRRKAREAGGRGQDRRPPGRFSFQRLPRLQPVFSEQKIVNMIGVCLDTTITTSKCDRYTFRPFDYAPAQAVAFAPYLVNKMGKKWHIAYADYSWGQSTRDAYADQIKKAGGEVVGTTGIPLGRADMTPFLSKISGNFDGLFGIFFGKDGVIAAYVHEVGLIVVDPVGDINAALSGQMIERVPGFLQARSQPSQGPAAGGLLDAIQELLMTSCSCSSGISLRRSTFVRLWPIISQPSFTQSSMISGC